MPRITVGAESFDVDEDKRLVLALEDNGVEILHRCGGYARCTTCRVRFLKGEPKQMTEAEKNRLQQNRLFGQVRLSCQILCNHGSMIVEPVMTMQNSEVDDPGKRPEEHITPEPEWNSLDD